MSFQGYWMEKGPGCLTDGEMAYDNSRIEPKRSHQWFMDGTEAELFPIKKQAVEVPSQNLFSGLLNSNVSSWGNPSSFQSTTGQFTERLFEPENARTVNVDDRNFPSLGMGSINMGRRVIEDPFGNDSSFGLSISHPLEDPRLGLNYGGIRKVKVSEVKDSENFMPGSVGHAYNRVDNSNVTTPHAYGRADDNTISMGLSYNRGNESIVSMGNAYNSTMLTPHSFAKADDNSISMGLSFNRVNDNFISMGNAYNSTMLTPHAFGKADDRVDNNFISMSQPYSKRDDNSISLGHPYKENNNAISMGQPFSKAVDNITIMGQTFHSDDGNGLSMGNTFKDNGTISMGQPFIKSDGSIPSIGQTFNQGDSNTVSMVNSYTKVDDNAISIGHTYNKVENNTLSLGHSFGKGESNIISFGGFQDEDDINSSEKLIGTYNLMMGQSSAQRQESLSEEGLVESNVDATANTSKVTSTAVENVSKEDKKGSKKPTSNNFPSNVRSLLSTGMLDGVPVKYIAWSREEVHGIIKGSGYLCGCQACNYSKVINAYEFERHAGCKTKHPNNHIYFENGKTVYGIVQELRSTPQTRLFEVMQTITGSPINQKSFRVWKDSFLAASRELQRIYAKDEEKQLS
ncbi:uncharacterized protein LOC131322824 isoform X2 [Rhododendron vialii]|uniref:uncharacterized protein LOC131322824 isoform X2 n=1 Tax=Rhododendron vialii TaxID=182163 RepID=UPI00265FE8C2|nr:uncharacterized protein LOC131322824 isoform X2 [Rhododendron vialii]XP_058210315.1 uncharacterized protein LOC131322824 isoform X2 [Rhododendron vialii]